MNRCALMAALVLLSLAVLPACGSAPRNMNAVQAYYRYDYPAAREALRPDAETRNNEQVILNNVRLGVAALADGDHAESERALDRVFQLLSTAGLNKDRTTAAVFFSHEGIRIWKGEPFEQALSYYWISALYAVMGDWENARAAAANSLFRLTDFGADQTPEKLARREAKEGGYLERGYNAVDTNFALGFLMQGLAAKHSGAAGSDDLLDAAIEINPSLKPAIDAIRNNECDTIFIIDFGKGPTKIAYGPDNAYARFQPQEHLAGNMIVTAGGREIAAVPPVCNVDVMAEDMRWNNLEDVRRAKSVLGDVLLTGGAVAAGVGFSGHSKEAGWAGLAAMLAGLALKSGAEADTRYMEFAPASIYIVPALIGRPSNVRIALNGELGHSIALPDFQPGSTAKPRAVYLRLYGSGVQPPAFLRAREPVYSNDHTGVRHGDYPWILGGHDVSTPSDQSLAAYQEAGYLTGLTLGDLIDLYAAEEIFFGSGMDPSTRHPADHAYRHILEGGSALYTPSPDSIGYKRLMFTQRPAYVPRSPQARQLAAAIAVRVNRAMASR